MIGQFYAPNFKKENKDSGVDSQNRRLCDNCDIPTKFPLTAMFALCNTCANKLKG